MTVEPAASATTSAPSVPMLELDGVNTYYGNIHALRGISLTVEQGEIVTLIGANGAGKTTTLKTISGLLHPREGRVSFEGQDVSRTAAHALVRAGIGQAPEGRRIFSRMTVFDNLLMGAFTRDKDNLEPDIERVFVLFP
ncbi:MAG: branched-chain amino acid transport system ATP-binding protein, partial [Chloroflexota bacterium]|nr:branched-chain amino acid transport system ATP-binding protein [Chloroflexota bacterium]